jgi:predicted HAD superfamily Cof-like phosphohydrolase
MSNEKKDFYEKHGMETAEIKPALIPVQAVQDNDCHWYVVPQDQIDEFNRLLDGGETTEDRFIELFSQYMTGGALNNTQLYACPGKTDEQGGVLTESNPGKYVVFHSEGPMPDLISQPIPENLKLSALEMVEVFHKAFGCPVLKTPGIPDMMGFQHKNFIAELEMILEKMKALNDRSRVALRAKLILEEFIELYAALFKGEIVKALDGLSDLLYVTYGTHHELGTAPIANKAFREVHRSNMSKLNGDGTPIIRNDGKVLKGPNFTPPDLAGIIADQMRQPVLEETKKLIGADTPVMKAAAEFKEQINQAAEMGKTLTPDVFDIYD